MTFRAATGGVYPFPPLNAFLESKQPVGRWPAGFLFALEARRPHALGRKRVVMARFELGAQEGTDEAFMRQALALAARGVGHTSPNPLVGAVIVREGRVIGQGWHACYGQAHAERNALDDCARRGEDPRGACVYVTLEPCSHHGKQPPCADALVQAGVACVVVGSRDPNPLVSGRGVERLQAAGIEVVQDFLRDECDAINQVFFRYITSGKPCVVAKWAMTADGRIACANGDARWVSGPESRQDAHALRNRLSAILVGIGTVRADDPLLTCRLEGGRNPLRVVCDSRLSIDPACALVRSAARGEAPLLVACVEGAAQSCLADGTNKREALRSCGVEVLELPAGEDGRVSLPALMEELGQRKVDSVLVEGGAHLLASVFEAGLVDEAVCYVAPKALCEARALSPVAGTEKARMGEALSFGAPQVDVLGQDVRLCWRVGASQAERALPCVACGPLYPGGGRTADVAAGSLRGVPEGLAGQACAAGIAGESAEANSACAEALPVIDSSDKGGE